MKTEGSGSSPKRIWTVYAVEDDPRARSFFEVSVRRSDRLRWIGSARTGAEAVAWMQQTAAPPDVLLVDRGLPDGSGLDVIREAVTRFADCDPLVVSVFGDEDNV